MGKQGPCHHCGVASTPLWRNGPPEKPVLCNACGSRWRTKGTLVNYTPLHARAEGVEKEIEVRIKRMSVNKKVQKRKSYEENLTVETANMESNTGFKRKAVDEEASNRSSSGSVVSNSESCEQSKAWDTTFPSKKRTCVGRPKVASSVEKLTKDLYTILQEQQSSCLSGSSEEDLLYENQTPMLIGHGSVLMRDPHSGDREVESEASSFLVETSKSSSGHSVMFGGKALKQEHLERSKSQGRHSSLDLKEKRNEVEDSVSKPSTVLNPSPSNVYSLMTIERPYESLNQNFLESRVVMRSPKEVMDIRSNHIETEEILENSVSSFKRMSCSGSLEHSYVDNDISDQDLLLLDVPSNGSFPQAELLHMI